LLTPELLLVEVFSHNPATCGNKGSHLCVDTAIEFRT
jgi:hypothetical protein